jgi:hypothetical protein
MQIGAASTVVLLSCGVAAALSTTLIDLHLRMPGHSILKAVWPFLVGMAIAPRRGAGTIMSMGSLGTLIALSSFGLRKGMGGSTSLLLLGPCLDLALLHARPNLWIYLRFALAGLAANGAAFAVQMTAKSLGLSLGGGKDVRTWVSFALLTYPLFGFVAGLISGLVLFHWGPWRSKQP